jgi:hypothetical protein
MRDFTMRGLTRSQIWRFEQGMTEEKSDKRSIVKSERGQKIQIRTYISG